MPSPAKQKQDQTQVADGAAIFAALVAAHDANSRPAEAAPSDFQALLDHPAILAPQIRFRRRLVRLTVCGYCHRINCDAVAAMGCDATEIEYEIDVPEGDINYDQPQDGVGVLVI